MTNSSYQEFESKKIICRDCAIGLVYNCVVCSDGCKENPTVMVVGECPGQSEIEEGLPFVGKAGKKLRYTLNRYGFRKTNTIISNIMPCRPLDNKFPTDSKLVKACYDKWLAEEIKLLKPTFLILLGNQPLQFILGLSGITTYRGVWREKNGIRVMPTYHPSYVIRKSHMEDGEYVEATFEGDLRAVAEAAHFSLTIS